jgi:hypothetical protein
MGRTGDGCGADTANPLRLCDWVIGAISRKLPVHNHGPQCLSASTPCHIILGKLLIIGGYLATLTHAWIADGGCFCINPGSCIGSPPICFITTACRYLMADSLHKLPCISRIVFRQPWHYLN